ncbi:MAG TPA: prolyl oligopeptidase family serine peptidase [Vicinamibacteria bacterium]|nr:prolyl oligopeptidase family serine peptidase [Vicinamibacteria bacterium]
MRKTLRPLVPLVLLAGALAAAPSAAPPTRRDEVRETIAGVEVADPYRWLEDQEGPETRAWIAAQNANTRAALAAAPDRDAIKRRLAELIKVDTVGIPVEQNSRYFFTRRAADQDLFTIQMRKGRRGPDEVLIDPHPWSADHSVSATLMGISKDGGRLAYGVRHGGEDEVTVKILDVDARRDLPDALPKGRYSGVAFNGDGRGLYFSRLTPEGPRVYFHAMGTDPANDVKLFGDGYGREKIIGVGVSDDYRLLIITVFHGSAGDKTEVYYKDLVKDSPVTAIVNDLPSRFVAQAGGDRMYLKTNWNAPKGRVLAVELANPRREQWKEVVPEGAAAIDDVTLAGGRIFATYLEDVRSAVKVFDPAGKLVRTIEFPVAGTVAAVRGQWDSDEAFLQFSSFVLPSTTYRYEVGSGVREEWARVNAPVKDTDFEVRQVWYTSKDGTRVPMFLVHRKGFKADGTAPALMTGYGGFTLNQTPAFSARATVWAEAGGVFALPNLRGGGEFGEDWHKAGMLDRKQNVFDDFIAAAEWLVKNDYTSPSRLAITGSSNGGLLVGAAFTQRPDLFAAVACRYPLLDMVRYHRFLVARYWVPEYGSADDAAQFPYIYAYSPYHHVKPGTKYPAVLFTSGDADTRVAPLHARKMAALVQSATASDKPVLLRYDTETGHSSGGTAAAKLIDELGDELAFLAWQVGLRYRH